MKVILHSLFTALAIAATACISTGGSSPSLPGPTPPPAPATRAWALAVANARTGEPLLGAAASLNAETGDVEQACAAPPCVTNRDGYLLYPALKLGDTYSLHVEMAGFLPFDASVTITAESADAQIQIASAIVIPETPRLHVDGRSFLKPDGTRKRLVLASELSPLRRGPPEWLANLTQWREFGFDGTRLFAGELGWADGQTEVTARAALPAFLEVARQQGLYTLVTAITGSATGFDVEAHLRAVRDIIRPFDGVIPEAANEWYHPSQSKLVNDHVALCALAKRVFDGSGMPWAMGAAPEDEPDTAGFYAGDCGSFATAHLDRGRDLLNQVRRVREIRAIKDAIGKAVGNTEPLGAAEVAQPGRRFNEPWWFHLLSVLNAGFNIDITVFHSEDGLNSRLLGPTQAACARAFVAGARLLPEEVFIYRNAGQGGPVKWAKFVEDGGPIVRAYSFLEPGEQSGFVVVIHTTDRLDDTSAVEMTPGWHVVKALPSMEHHTVYRVERDREPSALELPNAA